MAKKERQRNVWGLLRTFLQSLACEVYTVTANSREVGGGVWEKAGLEKSI